MSRHVRVVGFMFLVGALACSEHAKPPVEAKPTFPDSADQVLFGVRSPMVQNGVNRGELYADTMFIMNDQNHFDMRITHIDFNTETGMRQGNVRADKGLYDQRTQVLEGWGHVVVTMVDGSTLRSPHIKYDMPRALISSESNYVATGGGRSQHGIGFITDTGFVHFSCLSQCGGRMPVAFGGGSQLP